MQFRHYMRSRDEDDRKAFARRAHVSSQNATQTLLQERPQALHEGGQISARLSYVRAGGQITTARATDLHRAGRAPRTSKHLLRRTREIPSEILRPTAPR